VKVTWVRTDGLGAVKDNMSVFGLRNEVIYLLLTPHFFIWFVE
jgi:hypothetical protein